MNRTRRRDIGEFTIRKPETVNIDFTDEQRQLYEDLLEVQRQILTILHGDINVRFMMTTIMRQVASSLYGLVPFLEEILTRRLDELSMEEADDDAPQLSATFFNSIDSQISSILERARKLDSRDPKFEALLKVILDKQTLPNNKVMVFSSFRHTLNYLHSKLIDAGLRVGMVHGGTPNYERVELRNRFKLEPGNSTGLDILLFSEVGCEGLDYQFCDCLINYDLPWNPMRIEQRIGRIDRKGQKSESVRIVNLITPGTIDADIYERCLLRIGVFNSALGAGEEILGEISAAIKNIAENLTLSAAERKSKLQQLADNQIRLIQEQEKLESQQQELFGILLPQKQIDKEIQDATSYWLSPESLRKLCTFYLQRLFGKEQEFIMGERTLKTLRLSQDARAELLKEFQRLPKQNAPGTREWETWLKGGEQHLLLTFEPDCAAENPNAAFLTPLHPLIKQAAQSFDNFAQASVSLSVTSNVVPEGKYDFALFHWHFRGIREDLMLRPVSSSELLTNNLAKLLENAGSNLQSDSPQLQGDIKELETQHYRLWSEAKIAHIEKNRQLGEYRKQSLLTSHKARLALLNEQLAQSTNDKIRKMRMSQISAAELDYALRIKELDEAVSRADLTYELVTFGFLSVKKTG